MREYRVSRVESPRYPVVRLTFDDGFVGELDLAEYVGRGFAFTALKDVAFFSRVGVSDGGRCFGWRLDDVGSEIDFGADAARADIETALVEERADRYRRRFSPEAAE